MKRTIVILSTVVTVLAAGILYGGNVQTDGIKTLSLEETYNASFPTELPDVVMHPMNGTTIF
jgi:hypothetical protein